MSDAPESQTRQLAKQALALMQAQGFEAAQVDARQQTTTELNVAHNAPSLMRSSEQIRLVLTGLVDGRRASTELSRVDTPHLRDTVAALHAQALAAPQDDGHAVSRGEHVQIEQGPLQASPGEVASALAEAASGLLAHRAAHSPSVMVQDAAASFTHRHQHTLTSEGSVLSSRLAWYELSMVGNAREGGRASSMNYGGGASHALAGSDAIAQFGLDELMRHLTLQTEPRRLSAKFEGDVVLAPTAVRSLLVWLLAQLGDAPLLAGSSILRDRVGQSVASPLVNLRSRFDGPGIAAVSTDAFAALPLHLLQQGRLTSLLPTLYGSRKTGLPHRPVAEDGWVIDAGEVSRGDLVAGVSRGALVGRLSMGAPAANGDFAGVIKNSFAIEGGVLGHALAETMISGNIARMLLDVTGVSRERLDQGWHCLPWLRVTGLRFS